MEAPMPCQPIFHLGVLVCAVIIDDQMKIQVQRKLSIPPTQKLQELLVARR